MTRCWQKCLLWAAVALFAVSEVSAKPTIGMVLKSVRNEFFIEMAKGAQRYAKAHPDTLTLQLEGIQQEVDVSGQEAIIRTMIAQKVDALIVVPTDSVAMLPVLMEAIRAGILVINMDNKLDDRALVLEGVNIPFVGPSNFVGARSVGEYVAKALLCGNDNMAIGAAQALAELGLKGKVLLGGYDNIPGIHSYLSDGSVAATADQYPGKQAQYALDLALKALAQNTPQADLPGIVQTPVELVVHP